MYDKELIEKVCNLTCIEEDLNINQTSINYDIEYPFEKYYSVETIAKAISKYINEEWNDRLLSSWACIYNWIICGGFSDNLKERERNTIEKLLLEVITWDLDGLSFFDDCSFEEELEDKHTYMNQWIEQYRNLDNILKSANEWKGFYAPIGPYDEYNDEQYVVLVNKKNKQYIIIHTYFFENGFEDEYIEYLSEEEHIKRVKELEEAGYTLLNYSEEFYFDEIRDSD